MLVKFINKNSKSSLNSITSYDLKNALRESERDYFDSGYAEKHEGENMREFICNEMYGILSSKFKIEEDKESDELYDMIDDYIRDKL